MVFFFCDASDTCGNGVEQRSAWPKGYPPVASQPVSSFVIRNSGRSPTAPPGCRCAAEPGPTANGTKVDTRGPVFSAVDQRLKARAVSLATTHALLRRPVAGSTTIQADSVEGPPVHDHRLIRAICTKTLGTINIKGRHQNPTLGKSIVYSTRSHRYVSPKNRILLIFLRNYP